MANCWLERTPLEIGFLLILTVAVPFLIILTSVYIYMLLNNCPNCSIKCSDFCAEKGFANSRIVSLLGSLNPNITLPKLHEKYKTCSGSMYSYTDIAEHKFLASITENVYVDNNNEKRYLCAGAVITFKWVVVSSRCIQTELGHVKNLDQIFVRAGSNFWSKGGSIHGIKQILLADSDMLPTVAVIELKKEFPKLPSIRPIMLCYKSHYKNDGTAEIFNWKTNDSAPLIYRNKYTKVIPEPAVIFKDARCDREAKQSHVFCAVSAHPIATAKCQPYFGGFVLIREGLLIGIEIGQYCDQIRNNTVYLIYDVSKAMRWITNVTEAFVEHF